MNDTPAGAAATDISALSFEEALDQLGGIVRQLEAGQVPLDSAISLYERATALKAHCDARLKDAEARIERIRIGRDGIPTGTAPFDGDAA
jgi:exodeoxyribonuclease VII small subunit